MLSILQTMLKGLGAQKIHEAVGVAEAFEKFQSFPIDIIILDYALETLDGVEFCQLVRSAGDSANRYVPIIMLSAHTERIKVEKARDAGITEFLRKPVSARDLLDRIVEIVERPRTFLRTRAYFGPDRRRHDPDRHHGKERRVDRLKARQKTEEK